MKMSKEKKRMLIEKFKEHPTDTGSAAVQIAVLSERIAALAEHFKKHKKDFSSRRGLLELVERRRRLLEYLKNNSLQKYNQVVKSLNLRK